jgi:hypothetical protein
MQTSIAGADKADRQSFVGARSTSEHGRRTRHRQTRGDRSGDAQKITP